LDLDFDSPEDFCIVCDDWVPVKVSNDWDIECLQCGSQWNTKGLVDQLLKDDPDRIFAATQQVVVYWDDKAGTRSKPGSWKAIFNRGSMSTHIELRDIAQSDEAGARAKAKELADANGLEFTAQANPYRYHCGDCSGWFSELGEYSGSPVCPLCFCSDMGEVRDTEARSEAVYRARKRARPAVTTTERPSAASLSAKPGGSFAAQLQAQRANHTVEKEATGYAYELGLEQGEKDRLAGLDYMPALAGFTGDADFERGYARGYNLALVSSATGPWKCSLCGLEQWSDPSTPCLRCEGRGSYAPCPDCDGTGRQWSVTDTDDTPDQRACPSCGGTGAAGREASSRHTWWFDPAESSDEWKRGWRDGFAHGAEGRGPEGEFNRTAHTADEHHPDYLEGWMFGWGEGDAKAEGVNPAIPTWATKQGSVDGDFVRYLESVMPGLGDQWLADEDAFWDYVGRFDDPSHPDFTPDLFTELLQADADRQRRLSTRHADFLDHFKEVEHPRDNGGKFKEDGAPDQADEDVGSTTDAEDEDVDPQAPVEEEPPQTTGTGSKEDPVKTNSVEDAAAALGEGKYVELDQPKRASTLLDKLATLTREAKEKGEKAKPINLCNVTVPGTNLFCVESKGIPRIKMPQFKAANPLAGSVADGLERDERGEVDLQPAFRKHLEDQGVKVENAKEKASFLKASQNELNGAKVAGIAKALQEGVEMRGAIFVSSDNYIVDGHHRWAAIVGNDLADGVAGDLDMEIDRIDIPIIELLDLANKFAVENGLPAQGVDETTEPKAAASETTVPAQGFCPKCRREFNYINPKLPEGICLDCGIEGGLPSAVVAATRVVGDSWVMHRGEWVQARPKTAVSGEWHNSDGFSFDATSPELTEHLVSDHGMSPERNSLLADHVAIPWDPFDRDALDAMHKEDHDRRGECGAHEKSGHSRWAGRATVHSATDLSEDEALAAEKLADGRPCSVCGRPDDWLARERSGDFVILDCDSCDEEVIKVKLPKQGQTSAPEDYGATMGAVGSQRDTKGQNGADVGQRRPQNAYNDAHQIGNMQRHARAADVDWDLVPNQFCPKCKDEIDRDEDGDPYCSTCGWQPRRKSAKDQPISGYLWGEYADGKTREIGSGTWDSMEWTGKSMMDTLGQEGRPLRTWVTLSSDSNGKPVWTSDDPETTARVVLRQANGTEIAVRFVREADIAGYCWIEVDGDVRIASNDRLRNAVALKYFQGWIMAREDWKVRYRDGRDASQVEAAIKAPSRKVAAEVLGVTVGHVTNYMSETGNAECIGQLDLYPPLTVLLKAMNPGGTVMGQEGWIPRP
jgi:hypothetical protein